MTKQFQPMSREVFEQHRDEIDTAVKLLLTNPKLRKKFQLALVYEKRTSELLAEVLFTSFGPVVVYPIGVGATGHNTAMLPTIGTRQYRGHRVVSPLTGDVHRYFDVVSRSNAAYEIRAVDLVRVISGDVDPATLPNHKRFENVGGGVIQIDGDGAGALTFRRVATVM